MKLLRSATTTPAPGPSRGPVLALAACALALAGCAHFDSRIAIEHPEPERPRPVQTASVADGSIYQGASFRPLFEDPRARKVGDTLIVNINENMAASKAAATDTTHQGTDAYGVPILGGLPLHFLNNGTLSASSQSTFTGKGDSSANNVFTGTITVTVFEVLANGNLRVSGEKQIGINTGSEYIRLSGVVNPTTIQAGNVVSSTQIADARIEYRGKGVIDEAQTMPWAQRVFQNLLPF